MEPGARFNVIYGDNGQGKTNLLEAVYAVCTLRSFRTQRLAEIISLNNKAAYIAARVERGGLERIYELTLAERSRKVRLDGKSVRPISGYFGDFNVVLFASEDLRVPCGSPRDRRKFLDRAVFNWRSSYLPHMQVYEKVLKNRNALLKDMEGRVGGKADLLAVFDEQLSHAAARIIISRRQFVEAVRPRFSNAFERITQAGLTPGVAYSEREELGAAGDDEVELAAIFIELMLRERGRDLARGTSSVGPHRDDLVFTLEGQPVQTFASQGQLRAMVLAWKTAELDLLAETHGDPPILLLDDVSSELDPTRNQYLFDFLKERPSQCFITTTHPDHVLLKGDRVDFEVTSGELTRQKSW